MFLYYYLLMQQINNTNNWLEVIGSLTNTDIVLNQVNFIHHTLKWSCVFK